jgi:uncharacterized RDD family membrane protein YckC
MSHDNPYAAPQAEIGAILDAPETPLADRGTRFVAAFLDGLISLAYSLPLMYFMGFFDNAKAMQNASFTTLLGVSALSFVCFVLVHGYTLKQSGQTLGKKMTGIRIADLDDGVPDLGRVIGLRYLPITAVGLIPIAGSFLPLIDVLFIFRSDRRCIHDLIAGTKVVKVTKRQPEL